MERVGDERDKHGMPGVRGAWRGRVHMAEDFNELPADIARALGADAPLDALETGRRLVDEYEAERGPIDEAALEAVDAQWPQDEGRS
ncbi:MAG: hypothetical protein QOC78_1774 [Solirubrobacteraceae bacterium]|nr:hypothetical protein [Solirubrobacteraceae bacterium]